MTDREKFHVGQYIIYVNGDHYELGRIKSLQDNGAFVAYHEGETGAKTPYDLMHPLVNAFVIEKTMLGWLYFEQEDDLINRKAAIDALGKEGLITAMVIIDRVPTVTPKQHWIPCSERLPYAEYGESGTVLATCGYRDVNDGSIRWIRMLYYDGGNWCYLTGETYLGKVYAWMPLPEPFREEGEQE